MLERESRLRPPHDLHRTRVWPEEPAVCPDAGSDQRALPGAAVILSASGSHDPNGDALTYAWQVIRDNVGFDGGGIAVYDGGLHLLDSLVEGNVAIDMGGGVEAEYSELEIVRTELRNNAAAYDGGALWAYESTLLVSNAVIRENEQADADSAAVEVWDSYDMRIYNTVFLKNRGNGVADLYLNNGRSDVRNSIFGGATESYAIYNDSSTLSLAYNDIVGYWTAGFEDGYGTTTELENIALPPQFVSFSDDGVPENDDFTLLGSSPCSASWPPPPEIAHPRNAPSVIRRSRAGSGVNDLGGRECGGEV